MTCSFEPDEMHSTAYVHYTLDGQTCQGTRNVVLPTVYNNRSSYRVCAFERTVRTGLIRFCEAWRVGFPNTWPNPAALGAGFGHPVPVWGDHCHGLQKAIATASQLATSYVASGRLRSALASPWRCAWRRRPPAGVIITPFQTPAGKSKNPSATDRTGPCSLDPSAARLS
jgi:hypothetical protein